MKSLFSDKEIEFLKNKRGINLRDRGQYKKRIKNKLSLLKQEEVRIAINSLSPEERVEIVSNIIHSLSILEFRIIIDGISPKFSERIFPKISVTKIVKEVTTSKEYLLEMKKIGVSDFIKKTPERIELFNLLKKNKLIAIKSLKEKGYIDHTLREFYKRGIFLSKTKTYPPQIKKGWSNEKVRINPLYLAVLSSYPLKTSNS